MRTLRIATRESALALWQAEHVATSLRALHPGIEVVLSPMTTRGDQILGTPLSKVGGKGLFLKELEVAMQKGEADLAVHSLKDVPMDLEPGFELAAILQRADPFDAFVSNRWSTLAELPQRARVGTSSLRRASQLRAVRPDLLVADLRGNVNTRLRKLDEGQYDAIILASAGLLRLGLGSRIRSRLTAPEWIPAVAQGAIAIEIREGDRELLSLLAPLVDLETERCVRAERALNRRLHGGCSVPIGAYCEQRSGRLWLEALVGDGRGRLLRASDSGSPAAPEALGESVAEQLLAAGARELIETADA